MRLSEKKLWRDAAAFVLFVARLFERLLEQRNRLVAKHKPTVAFEFCKSKFGGLCESHALAVRCAIGASCALHCKWRRCLVAALCEWRRRRLVVWKLHAKQLLGAQLLHTSDKLLQFRAALRRLVAVRDVDKTRLELLANAKAEPPAADCLQATRLFLLQSDSVARQANSDANLAPVEQLDDENFPEERKRGESFQQSN